jgi:DNA gyrase inhibitor GyrI
LHLQEPERQRINAGRHLQQFLSGEQPRNYPLFVQRLLFFPDVAEHDAVLDMFLPLKNRT